MKISNIRKISQKEAYRLGIPGEVWLCSYESGWKHFRLRSKSFLGLLAQIVKNMVK